MDDAPHPVTLHTPRPVQQSSVINGLAPTSVLSGQWGGKERGVEGKGWLVGCVWCGSRATLPCNRQERRVWGATGNHRSSFEYVACSNASSGLAGWVSHGRRAAALACHAAIRGRLSAVGDLRAKEKKGLLFFVLPFWRHVRSGLVGPS